MKIYIIAISMFLTASCGAQMSFMVQDGQSGNILKELQVDGLENYTIFPNGRLSFQESELTGKDSIIIFHPGYEQKVFFAPFVLSETVLLYPLSGELDQLIISVDLSEQKFIRSTGSVSRQSSREILAFEDQVFASSLNELPGVHIQSGTSNTHRLSIRGIGSRTPYSSNRVRAYLDDLPLTDGNGVTTIEDIDPNLIASVEVLKGPGATLYGSGPGGILKINTRFRYENEKPSSIRFNSDGFGGIGISANSDLNFSNDKKLRFFASHFQTDGYRENNSYERTSFFTTGKYQLGTSKIGFLVLYNYLFGNIPSSLNESDFNENPKKAAQNWLDVSGYEAYHRLAGNMNIQTIFGERWSNKLNISAGYKDPFEVRPFNILDEESYFYSVQDHLRYYQKNLQVSLNLIFFYDKYEWTTFELEDKVQGMAINSFKERKLNFTGSLTSRYVFTKNLTAEGGFSINNNRYQLTDQMILEYGTDTYRFDPVISPMMGMNFRMNERLSLFASLRHGFSPPSIEEAMMPEGNINTNLKPESGWMTEGGIRGILTSRIHFDATIYSMDIRNLLVTKRISEESFMGINAGKVRYQGLEGVIKINVMGAEQHDDFNLKLNSAFTKTINRFIEFKDDGMDHSGNELPGIPSFVWNNQISLIWKTKLSLNFSYAIYGKQYITDDNTEIYEGYQLSHLSLKGKAISNNHLEIHFNAGVRNLFNEHYASMILINAPSFGNNKPRYYYPGQLRNWFAGIEIKF